MTMKEQIQQDTVIMRWVRTAATTVVAASAALGVLWAATVWTVGPRVNIWATGLISEATSDLEQEVRRNGAHLDRLDQVTLRLEEVVTSLADLQEQDTTPSWRWSTPDTSISDGAVGGRVEITAAGYKLRDCGVPTVDLYFVNGSGSYHRFEDASILTTDNRGIALLPDPTRLQILTYTARIPADDDVSPGRGLGFISVTYVDCPLIDAAVAGPLQFRITNGTE